MYFLFHLMITDTLINVTRWAFTDSQRRLTSLTSFTSFLLANVKLKYS